MATPVAPTTHTFLKPSWFWDGKSERAHREVGVYIRGETYQGTVLPTHGISFSATQVPLPGRLVTPGLVNFHAHLELSLVPRPPYSGDFVEWLGTVMARGPRTPDVAALAAARGAGESMRAGVTRVVDNTRNPETVREHLRRLPLRVDSCGEVTGLAKRFERGGEMRNAALGSRAFLPYETEARDIAMMIHELPVEEQARRVREVMDEARWSNRVVAGVAPHACYSTDASWYEDLARDVRHHGCPFTTHLAETPYERQFLRDHTGPFRELWNRLGDWKEGVETFPLGPIWWLEHHGVLDSTNLIAAHVNDVDDEELKLLARRKVTVVHCPRTHAYFGRARFEIERYRKFGVRVKLGTDSAASAGDANLLKDLQLFARQNPELSPGDLFGMVMDGAMEVGAPGDFVVWRVYTDDPIRELLTTEGMRPEAIYIAGEEVRLTQGGV